MPFQMPRVASQGAVGVGVPQVRGIGQGQEVNAQTMAAIRNFGEQIKQKRLAEAASMQTGREKNALIGQIGGGVDEDLPVSSLQDLLNRKRDREDLLESREYLEGQHQRELAEVIQGKAVDRYYEGESLKDENARTDMLKNKENERLRGVAQHKLGGQIALEGMRQQGLSARSKDKDKGSSGGDAKTRFAISKQFEADPSVKRFRDVNGRVNQIERALDMGIKTKKFNAADQVLIINFNKMLDDSTVRVSEYARFGISQGWVDSILGKAEGIMSGGANLTEEERKSILRIGRMSRDDHSAAFESIKDQYTSIGKGSDLNTENLFREPTDFVKSRTEKRVSELMSGGGIGIDEAALQAAQEEQELMKRLK